MKHPFFSYRTGFMLTAICLVFLVGAIAGTRFALTSADLADSGLITDLKSAVAPEALAGFNATTLYNDYDGYTSWTHTTTLKADDTMAQTLNKLARVNSGYIYTTLTDINGDGMVDVLYHDTGSTPIKFGVYINNGNLGFTWGYKCVLNMIGSTWHYYGDCAG